MRTLTAPAPVQKADSLTSRLYAATLGVEEPQKTQVEKNIIRSWLQEVAKLAGMTFEARPSDYFVFEGQGLTLEDSISTYNPSFNLTGLYPKAPGNREVRVNDAQGRERAKPSLRLTPGLNAVQAAKRVKESLAEFRSYHEAVVANIELELSIIDRTRQQAEDLLEAAPGRWYTGKPTDKVESRKLVFYLPSGTHYAEVRNGCVLVELKLSAENAAKVLALVASLE